MAYRGWRHPVHVSWAHFPPVARLNEFFPAAHPRWGKGGNNTNNSNTDPEGPGTHRTLLPSPHGLVPELWLALPWRTAAGRTRHTSPRPISPPLGSIKRIFPGYGGAKGAKIPRVLTPLGPVPPVPFYNPHSVRSLNFAWLSPLLGATGTCLLGPFAPPPSGLDKINFPRVPTPSEPKRATIPTTRTRSRT